MASSSNSRSSKKTKAPSSKNDDVLNARPTQRLGDQTIEADGDTWQETLAVCEPPQKKGEANPSAAPTLILRSYYQNTRSGKRVWDEPPSGASKILPATDEMRRMAEMQLTELHVVTTSVAVSNAADQELEEPKKKKKGLKKLFGSFGKKKTKEDSNSAPKQNRQIRYKPGSRLVSGPSNPDSQLQLAIARSLADKEGRDYEFSPAAAGGDPSNNLSSSLTAAKQRKKRSKTKFAPLPTVPPAGGADDDELEMAKALSLSVAHQSGETEEQLLARVMEESRMMEEALQRGANQAAREQQRRSASGGNLMGFSGEIDRKMPPMNRKMPPPAASLSHSPQPYYSQPVASAAPPMAPASPFLPSYSAAGHPTVAKASPADAAATAARFDPYSAQAAPKPKPAPQKASPSSPSGPQKMSPPNSPLRPSFGRPRVSNNKKLQEQAGLV